MSAERSVTELALTMGVGPRRALELLEEMRDERLVECEDGRSLDDGGPA